ncbi:MAG: lysyl oxidase family protein [Saprospiraceae bacterium]
MKKFSNVSKATFAISLFIIIVTFHSCQKDQVSNTVPSQKLESRSSKTGDGIVSSSSILLPDLTIDSARLKSSAVVKNAVFKTNDCALVEGCVGGTGKRKLLRFDVATPNIGTADLVLGDPSSSSLFLYSACHRHYHFSGYAKYELLNSSDVTIITGRKQAFCLEDYAKYATNAGPGKFTCSNQGITVGWQDIYGSYLDCQWLDITDLAPGNYKLRVSINPEATLLESNYANNVAVVLIKVNK